MVGAGTRPPVLLCKKGGWGSVGMEERGVHETKEEGQDETMLRASGLPFSERKRRMLLA